MKNLKKVIALVAVLALTLSTVALGASYSDVADDSAYSVAVESLSKLGIVTGYEDGTYGPEKAVTRAEMAALIARIQGYEESAKANANTAFTDVPSEYWASGYIAQAANQGIVNGYGDGTFGPDDTVKYEQAVTMIMRTLGYDPFAANNGGYPTGYLAAAQRYGVTKNVSNAVAGTDANRGTIAQLLYNGIDTAIMAQSKWGSDGKIEYTIYDGSDYYTPYKTLMSENLGVVKLKGTITKTPYSSTTGTVTINNSERAKVSMTIFDNYDTTNKDFDYSDTAMNNGTVKKDLLVGDSDVCDFLGYRVIAYVVESDNYAGEYEVLSAAKDSATNNEISFTLDKFDSLASDKLEYFKNDTDRNTTKLNLQKGANTAVVFNNVGGHTASDVFTGKDALVKKDMTAGGMITLVDNDSTDGYDVIFVEVGSTAVVDEVNKTKVTFKEAAAMPQGASLASIDVDDEDDSEAFFFKDGKEIAVTDLKEWDVLTIIAENKNASYIVAEVIGSPVTGTVSATTSSDTSEGGTAYKIEGTTYDVAANAYGVSGLEVGDAGIFYIDKYGKIAAFDEDSSVAGSAGNYAYVLKTSFDKDDFDEYTMQFKLVTANGVDTYELANKVTVSGIAKDTDLATTKPVKAKATKTTNKLASGAKEKDMKDWADSFKNMLIKYTANSAGEITSITLAGYDDDKFSSVRDEKNAEFDKDLMRIGKQNIDEKATLFLIDTDSDSDCMVGTVADLDDGQSYTSYAAYLDSKGDDANIVVVTGYKAAATSSSAAVIASVGRGQNSDLEDVYVLDYYVNGELKEGVMTNNDVYTKEGTLSEGDIILVKVSSAGVITGVNVLVDFGKNIRTATAVDATAKKPNTLKDGAYKYTDGNKLVTVFGYATEYSKGSKTVTMAGDNYKLSNAKNVYVIDPALKNNKVDAGSVGDYTFDTDLMADLNDYKVTLYEGKDKTGKVLGKDITAADAYAKYADYVFVREYDNRVEDVVIIKAYSDDYSAESVKKSDDDKKAEEAAKALAAAKAEYDKAEKAYDGVALKKAYDDAKAAYDTATDKAAAKNKVVKAATAWDTAAKALADKAAAVKKLDDKFDDAKAKTAAADAAKALADANALA